MLTARVSEAAADDDLAFDWDRAVRANTFDAHRLCALALELGGPALQSAAVERFHAAHFAEGLAIDDHRVLLRAAEECGLDERRVAAVLAGDDYADVVRADEQAARALGVTSVPVVVANGMAALGGARTTEDYLALLRGVATPRLTSRPSPGSRVSRVLRPTAAHGRRSTRSAAPRAAGVGRPRGPLEQAGPRPARVPGVKTWVQSSGSSVGATVSSMTRPYAALLTAAAGRSRRSGLRAAGGAGGRPAVADRVEHGAGRRGGELLVGPGTERAVDRRERQPERDEEGDREDLAVGEADFAQGCTACASCAGGPPGSVTTCRAQPHERDLGRLEQVGRSESRRSRIAADSSGVVSPASRSPQAREQ